MPELSSDASHTGLYSWVPRRVTCILPSPWSSDFPLVPLLIFPILQAHDFSPIPLPSLPNTPYYVSTVYS
jgi:hypothetical protein